MPQIDLVRVMKKPPGRCGICNTTPMENGEPKEAIDTNVDVDWGNNFYICDECASVIADLIGRVEVEDYENLKAEHGQLRKDHENLRAKFKDLSTNMKKMVEGRKVERAQRANRKRSRA